jgi:hypothetical protein
MAMPLGRVVGIQVDFDGKTWKVVPDPVQVTRGEAVQWHFAADSLAAAKVRWIIDFEPPKALQTLPFGGERPTIDTATSSDDGRHDGSTEPQPTTSSGTFKYSVRAQDMESGKDIGMVDPILIVRPSIGLDAPATDYRLTPPARQIWREAGSP